MAARLDKLIVSHATHKIIAYKSLILDASGQIFTNNTNKNYKTCLVRKPKLKCSAISSRNKGSVRINESMIHVSTTKEY